MVAEGLSPERLSPLIKAKGTRAGFAPRRVRVSADTLRLVYEGHEPGPRVKHAIALYYGLRPGQIWERDSFDDVAGGARIRPPAEDVLGAVAGAT